MRATIWACCDPECGWWEFGFLWDDPKTCPLCDGPVYEDPEDKILTVSEQQWEDLRDD